MNINFNKELSQLINEIKDAENFRKTFKLTNSLKQLNEAQRKLWLDQSSILDHKKERLFDVYQQREQIYFMRTMSIIMAIIAFCMLLLTYFIN